MAEEETILGLALGFVLLAVAFVFGPGLVGLACGFFGGLMVMMSGLTLFMSKIEHGRGD